jgi:hypothetical protein
MRLLNAELFKVNALPLVNSVDMIVKGAIEKHFIAQWTMVLYGRRVQFLHVPLHSALLRNRFSAYHADEALSTLLHLSLYQQLQLLVVGVVKI